MRITTKGRYALRAVTRLAIAYKGNPISIKNIAETEGLSPEFLEQIFFRLRKADIISSTRGPGGGFSLKKDPKKIKLTEIFEAVGEGVDLSPCSTEKIEGCPHMDDCITHGIWENATKHIRDYFDGISVNDVVEKKITV